VRRDSTVVNSQKGSFGEGVAAGGGGAVLLLWKLAWGAHVKRMGTLTTSS